VNLSIGRKVCAARVDVVLKRLGGRVSGDERALVQGLVASAAEAGPGAELLTEPAGAPSPRVILSGWACRQRLLPDGRRQIFDLLVPGDMIGLAPGSLPLGQASTVSLTRTATVDASPLIVAAQRPSAFPAVARLVAATPAIDEERLMNHVVRLGRFTAYERVVHLLLELGDRLAAAGLGDKGRFPLPVTQEVLADALGLSVVHMNRILQQLRRESLIQMGSGHVTLLAREALETVAGP